jgi:signal transduction histidine kinase
MTAWIELVRRTMPACDGQSRASGGAAAVLRVRNAGEGIPASLLPHVFDRFVRGQGSTGLGLGLYLAREIARAHGGEVSADADPGGGTSFRVRLPLRGR